MSNSRLGWIKSAVGMKRASSSTSSRSSTPLASASSYAGPATSLYKDDKNRVAEYFNPDDQCGTCKSDRYLNKNLRLLVSTACYHKMCESCIDRLFMLGPAPCPVPECTTIVRKATFKMQTFEDLKVEEEVAVRRRMAKHFNKRREDFEDTRSYNDYLEEVEDITFNLLNKVDLDATEARIAAFVAHNASIIAANASLLTQEATLTSEREALEREERDWRRSQAALAEAESQRERDKKRKKVLRELEFSSRDVGAIVEDAKSTAQEEEELRAKQAPPPPSFLSRLKKRTGAAATAPTGPPPPYRDPYDSYAGLYSLRGEYVDPATTGIREDRTGALRAGGFKVSEVWERAVRGAVAGLAVPVLREEDDGPGGIVEEMVVD